MKIFCTILVLVIMGCNPNKSNYDTKHLIGHWAESEDHNVDFTLKEDGIIKYFEDNDVYNYYVKNKELIIKQEGHLITSYVILYLSADSLHLKTEEGNIFKLVKRK